MKADVNSMLFDCWLVCMTPNDCIWVIFLMVEENGWVKHRQRERAVQLRSDSSQMNGFVLHRFSFIRCFVAFALPGEKQKHDGGYNVDSKHNPCQDKGVSIAYVSSLRMSIRQVSPFVFHWTHHHLSTDQNAGSCKNAREKCYSKYCLWKLWSPSQVIFLIRVWGGLRISHFPLGNIFPEDTENLQPPLKSSAWCVLSIRMTV